MNEKPRPTLADTRQRASAELARLVEIMARLRGPGGCPWDREQTFESLKPYLVEEAYEVLDAMDAGSAAEHREELGDLLLQIVFQAEIAREAGDWDLADVVQGIADKLEYRHPHVFGGGERLHDAQEVEQNWARLKAKEKERKKGGRVSAIAGVPSAAPALLRAERITEKASRIGFDWPDAVGVRAKLDEELAELDRALASGDARAVEHELGDVLFTLANLARHLRTPAEDALRSAIRRFEDRFHWMEARLHERGLPSGERAAPEELDALWEEAKAREGSR
ncbi:MAG TPA: nucleoside triphosphate pyrophosphohydrolase [Vulgatibacter sp.]|nr:nucleoside triphosphate pyrophosphohydrolase [Vulgatibacter sp.]